VLELTQARVRFLANGFPEAVGELALGRQGKVAFERLLDLAQIHRPLAALVVGPNGHLSASIKSFGLLHYLGSEPSADKSLAVQALLRDEEGDDDEDVSDIVRSCEEQELVSRVLGDYQQLYPFAEDGLRILAVNVRDLRTILAGVDHFLEDYLKRTSADWPAFHCTVMVYSTSSSPMAMEKRLTLWRNHVVEFQREKGRQLILSVGHRYAPKQQVIDLLKQEKRSYDIAFLFHFLRGELVGRAIAASPFEFNFEGWGGVQFPIAEYPRPIQQGDRYRRQSLLSNRRLRIQTRHADLSAKLCYDGSAGRDHLIIGQVDYEPWASVVETLHQRAQWVACVDPFVDKRLLSSGDSQQRRKIVGFTSGLGAYGELNRTISTEQDTLKQLTDQVAGKLSGLLPLAQSDGFESMAARVVGEAEEIIGLSSLRAVVGVERHIREVVGFAAIRRALAPPSGQMSQLLPVDSLLHWFAGGEVTRRPDLLQLTLEARPDDIPLVHAVVIECKLAQQNPVHLANAKEQVQEGLRHLTGLLAPKRACSPPSEAICAAWDSTGAIGGRNCIGRSRQGQSSISPSKNYGCSIKPWKAWPMANSRSAGRLSSLPSGPTRWDHCPLSRRWLCLPERSIRRSRFLRDLPFGTWRWDTRGCPHCLPRPAQGRCFKPMGWRFFCDRNWQQG